MSDRQPGWYWVKVDGIKWEAACWDGRAWLVAGSGRSWPESQLGQVGPRIPAPDEPWQTVPVKPTDEMTRSMNWFGEIHPEDMGDIYADMLAAAPKPGGEHE